MSGTEDWGYANPNFRQQEPSSSGVGSVREGHKSHRGWTVKSKNLYPRIHHSTVLKSDRLGPAKGLILHNETMGIAYVRCLAIAKHLTYAIPIVSLCNINPFAGPNLSLLSTVEW